MAPGIAPSPLNPATLRCGVCRSERGQSMTAESAGCRPFARIPVPIQDTYSMAEMATLLCEAGAVYELSCPCPSLTYTIFTMRNRSDTLMLSFVESFSPALSMWR